MARVNNLTNFLTDVASAIKTKLGDNTSIPAAEFDSKIMEIETAGNYQNKSITITTNGNYNLLPDTGFDAMDQVGISVNVPSDTPIKLYASREEMMADTTEPEHEYGVVYGDKTQPVTEGMSTTQFVCKETVVLDSAITSSLSWYNDSHDLNIRITATSARIMYYGTSIKSVSYTSSDGITYTTTATLANRTFEGDFTFSSTSYSWIPQISDFLIAGGMYFEGMYEYVNEADDEYFDAITSITLTDTTFTSTNEEIYLPTLNAVMNGLYQATQKERFFVYIQNNVVYAQEMASTDGYAKIPNNNSLCVALSSSANTPMPYYILDLENDTFELGGSSTATMYGDGGSYGRYYYKEYPFSTTKVIGSFYRGNYYSFGIRFLLENTTATYVGSYSQNCEYGHVSFLTWHHVKTEFTLEEPNQLYPGVIALGKHGPVTGTDDIWNKYPNKRLIEDIYGLDNIKDFNDSDENNSYAYHPYGYKDCRNTLRYFAGPKFFNTSIQPAVVNGNNYAIISGIVGQEFFVNSNYAIIRKNTKIDNVNNYKYFIRNYETLEETLILDYIPNSNYEVRFLSDTEAILSITPKYNDTTPAKAFYISISPTLSIEEINIGQYTGIKIQYVTNQYLYGIAGKYKSGNTFYNYVFKYDRNTKEFTTLYTTEITVNNPQSYTTMLAYSKLYTTTMGKGILCVNNYNGSSTSYTSYIFSNLNFTSISKTISGEFGINQYGNKNNTVVYETNDYLVYNDYWMYRKSNWSNLRIDSVSAVNDAMYDHITYDGSFAVRFSTNTIFTTPGNANTARKYPLVDNGEYNQPSTSSIADARIYNLGTASEDVWFGATRIVTLDDTNPDTLCLPKLYSLNGNIICGYKMVPLKDGKMTYIG